MRLKRQQTYQVVESSDVSHVAARRRRITAVAAPGHAHRDILIAMATRYAKDLDILFLFIWDDTENVGVKAADSRATFVREGADAVPSLPKDEVIRVRDGSLYLEVA